MKNRTLLVVLVLLVVAIFAFAIWRSSRPGAAGVQASNCLGTPAVVAFDGNAPERLTVTPKPIDLDYPSTAPNQKFVCWQLSVTHSADPYPFEKLEIVSKAPPGAHGRPLLAGNGKFHGGTEVKLRLDDEPLWGKITHGGKTFDGVRFGYEVVARLKGADRDLDVDPDIILRKPPGASM